MAILSVIQPRNPHRWCGFKTVFEEVVGHREARGPRREKVWADCREEGGSQHGGGGWWEGGGKDSSNETERAKLCGKEREE